MAGRKPGRPARKGPTLKEEQMPPRNTIDRNRVRELLRQGVSQKHIAERLGVSTTTVHHIAAQMRKEAANG